MPNQGGKQQVKWKGCRVQNFSDFQLYHRLSIVVQNLSSCRAEGNETLRSPGEVGGEHKVPLPRFQFCFLGKSVRKPCGLLPGGASLNATHVAFTAGSRCALGPFSWFPLPLPYRVFHLNKSDTAEWCVISYLPFEASWGWDLFWSVWPSHSADSVNRKGHPLIRCLAASSSGPFQTCCIEMCSVPLQGQRY